MLIPLKIAFIKCDKNKSGLITVDSFVKRLHKMGLEFNHHSLNFIINTLLDSSKELKGSKELDVNSLLNWNKL